MHKDWLDKEYQQFIEALQSSTVNNFKSNPMVKRMLSLDMEYSLHAKDAGDAFHKKWSILLDIDAIGTGYGDDDLRKEISSGAALRMIYYAQKVLNQKPTAICEIGGGCGQFYATIRALGFTGDYWIYDLPDVQTFQRKYLDEVTKQTGLNTELKETEFDFCVSLYALGEFDDETKGWYVENVVKKCPHGLVVWNPHSGASDEITWDCKVEPENPLTAPNNKLCTW